MIFNYWVVFFSTLKHQNLTWVTAQICKSVLQCGQPCWKTAKTCFICPCHVSCLFPCRFHAVFCCNACGFSKLMRIEILAIYSDKMSIFYCVCQGIHTAVHPTFFSYHSTTFVRVSAVSHLQNVPTRTFSAEFCHKSLKTFHFSDILF